MKMASVWQQRGLSLIELMIGILLSAVLLLGVLQIFDSNRNTMHMQNALARVQESGRFAMDYLIREIRMADYWGCKPTKSSIRNHLDTSDPDYAGYNLDSFLVTNAIRGQDNAKGQTVGGLQVIEGSDMLVLGGSADACQGTGRMVPSVSAAALQVSPECSVEPGQIVLIASCDSGELMTITNVQGGGSGNSGKKTIVHETGKDADHWVKNASKTLQRKYGAEARLLTPYLKTFFIAKNEDGGSSLFVSESGAGTYELVPGIEGMQILYGWDANGDDAVDTWGEAQADAAIMQKVISIKVQLLVASDERATTGTRDFTDLDGKKSTYSDGKLRKTYLGSAKIRNRGKM